MKKIAFLTYKLSGKGGTETVLSSILSNMNNIFNFDLVIPVKMKSENWLERLPKNINIIYNNKENKLSKLKTFLYYLITAETDVVICFTSKTVKIAQLVKNIFRKKYQICSWLHFSPNQVSFINIKDFKCADFHLAISSGIQNQLLEIGIPKDKIFLIYNPVKREKLVQEDFDINKDVKKLLYVGRIENKQKNIKLLLDSLNGFGFDWQLDIYGDGPDFQTMQNYAKQNVNNNQNIIWHGWNNDPWKDIKQADLLLLTSNYEGFGMVLVEAIARGIPCISSNCPVGPEDIIKDGINGLLFKVGDKEDLVSKAEAFFKTQDNYKPIEIAGSIEQFYEDNYFKNLKKILNES